jgi:hypothetical protein
MSDTETATDKTAQPGALPLFYRKPEALTAELHGSLSLQNREDFNFARQTNAVPIMDVEFAATSRWYPIVFTAAPVGAVAILGLQSENLFIEADGKWAGPDRYVPAYVRRYPFVFIQHGTGFVLGLDRECDRVIGADKKKKSGEPLFVDGQPSTMTKEALNFSAMLQTQHGMTRAFGDALEEQGLLIDRQANAVLADGRRFNMQGFRIVDAAKFQALPEAVVADWHKKGWLSLVHFHLASLERFHDLMQRLPAGQAA